MDTTTSLKKIINKQKGQYKRRQTIEDQKAYNKKLYEAKEWYTIRAILGNQWANWFILAGARERGKTFSVQDFVLHQYFNPKSKLYHKPFYWMRLNDIALKNMLMNNGAKMFEPLLVRKYHLEGIKVSGDTIYLTDGQGRKTDILCYCYGLSVAYNNKGAALFDQKTFNGVNIIVDEIAFEKGQRRTFDVVYNLRLQIENICRSSRDNVRVFFMLNNTEECPEIMSMFGFIPLEFGVYKLKRKHCVIDYIPNNAAYEKRRKNALANELDTGTGNFTNKIKRDIQLIHKGRLTSPTAIIKFSKDPTDWFTIWDNKVICPYNEEKKGNIIAMKRYIDEVFNPELRDSVIEINDVRGFRFRNILTQTLFYKALEGIKK